MAVLKAIFKAVDQMSATLDKMGEAGEKALSQWEKSAEAADEALGRAADSTEELSKAASKIDDSTGSIDKLGDSIEAVARSTDTLTGQWNQTGEGLETVGEEVDGVTDKYEEVGEESEKAGKKSQQFGKKSVQAVKSLEGALASAGIIVALKKIADGFFEASEAAAGYEFALAKVSTVADTTQVDMGTMADDITALSMETGKSVEELSDTVYNAISATGDTVNAVELASSATKLATAGFTDTGNALSVLTATLNAYGLSADTVTSISDSLIATQNLGVTTIDQLASSMGRAISTASAYSIDLNNLEAAYVSLTKNGVSTEESTTYLASMFNELGSSGSTVATILQEQTGMSFGQLMSSGYTLADALSILYDSCNNDAEALMNLWGSAEAGKASNAIVSQGLETFNNNLAAITDSAGTTASAYEAMTNTTAHGSDRMQNSFQNLGISIGTAVNPAMEQAYNLIADVTDGITEFANAHPAVVAGITAAIAVLGVAVVGIVGFSVATAAATAITATFGTTVATVFLPITAITAAVAALVVGIATVVDKVSGANAEFDGLTATSKAQYEQLEELNAEYDEAVVLYGENSAQAQALSQDIAGLEAEYEACKGTIEDFIAENDALIESHTSLMASYQNTSSQLDQEEKGTTALVGKLSQLAAKTNLTVGEQRQMSAIVDKLNSTVPSLGLVYDSTTNSLNKSVDAVRALAEAEAEQRRQQENYDAYVDLLADQADLQEQLARTTEETAAAQARYDSSSGFDQFWNVGKVKSDLEDFTDEQERLQTALDETNALIAEHEQAFESAAESTASASVAADDYETAVGIAISSVSDDMSKLATSWDETYEATRANIDNIIGLFDTMKTESELSVEDMTASLQSQVEYLNTYSENLRKAAEYGLDDGLIASLSDGSAESAGYLDTIINKIETLGGTTEGLSQDAAAFVETFNGQFAQVSAAKDEFSTTVTSMKEDLDAATADMERRMNEAVSNMNLSTEAAASASATINAYISSIRNKISETHDAAAAVAAAAQSGLSSGGSSTKGYATGTTYAESGFHVVGEEGPEVVFFKGGETVLNANETRQYFAGQRPLQATMPAIQYGAERDSFPMGERRIILEIAGRGSLELTGGQNNAEAAAVWLEENLRPMLINILAKEIQEEGNGSYEF